MADHKGPKQPGWKRQAGANNPPKQPPGKNWQQQTPGGNQPPVSGWNLPKRAKVALFSGVLLAVVGVGFFLAYKPTPVHNPQIVLLGAGYEDNLAVPHNVAGRKSLLAMKERLAAVGDIKDETLDKSTNLAELIKSARELKQRPEIPLIIYIGAHGVGVNEGGKNLVPCLLPDDYDHASPDGVLRLEDLLKQLQTLPDTKKLLILDVVGLRGDWTLGQFNPSILQALDDFDSKFREVKNLVVMVSASDNEPSWVAPEFGTTVFAHYLIQGLQGAAAGEAEPVTVEKLYTYVKQKVHDWTRHNRARKQTPKLIDPNELARHFTLINQGNPDPPSPEPATAILAEAESRGLWDECLKLEARSPWLTDPVRWRKYQDCLLRLEDLFRAGLSADDKKVLAVRRMADVQRDELLRPVKLTKSSVGLTLTMPAVLAAEVESPGKDWLSRFNRWLKESNYEECVKELDKLAKDFAGKGELPLLRNRASAEFVRHVAGKPETLWKEEKAQVVLARLIDSPTELRPAEAHFLRMLRPEDKDGGPLKPLLTRKEPEKAWPLIKKALEVRLLAEEAAAGLRGEERSGQPMSAEVLAWTRDMVEKADEQRRKGCDLLFTSEQENRWDEAEKALDAADAGYRQVGEEAVKVREAILARARAMARLPYYTRWLALREKYKDNEDAGKRLVKDSWDRLRELEKLLSNPADPAGRKDDKLKRATLEVNKSMDEIKEEYVAAVAANRDARHVQKSWHEIDALLRVPVADPGLNAVDRAQLVAKVQQIARELRESADSASKDAEGVESSHDDAKKTARRQGRYAVLTLADRDKVPDDWEDKAESGGFFRVGLWVSNQLRGLAVGARDSMKAADGKDLDRSIKALDESVDLARRVEGWVHDGLLNADPSEARRKLLLHRYLCWQARRAYLDHWAADPAARDAGPYYRRVGLGFLGHALEELPKDAADRDGKKVDDPRLAVYARLEKQLKLEQPFVVESSSTGPAGSYSNEPKKQIISDEKFIPRSYRVRGPVDEVQGDPVAWVDCEKAVRAPPEELPRRVRKFGDSFPGEIIPVGEIGRRPAGRGRHVVKGFFRGHEDKVETDVRILSEPDLSMVMPPVDLEARLSVQARPEKFGPRTIVADAAVAIVLDCSGSMVKEKVAGTTESRWDEARKALRDVMKDLPRGVRVSSRAFSAEQNKPVIEDINIKPEDVEQSRKTRWANISRVWESHRWNPSNLDARMKEIDDLTPSGATPLMRAIWMARNDFPKDFKGRRIMLVVTDGGDSNFYDTEYNIDAPLKAKTGANTITDFLRAAFRKGGEFGNVEVHVVGFDIREDEGSAAMKQAAKELPRALEELDGKRGEYHLARNRDALARHLASTLLSKTFKVDADFGRPGHDKTPEAGTLSDLDAGPGSLRWLNLPAKEHGAYMVRIPAFRGLEQRIRLDPGDSLSLRLVEGSGRLPQFQRMIYARSTALGSHSWFKIDRVTRPGETWDFAAMQKQLEPTVEGRQNLSLMTTIEQVQGPGMEDRTIQTPRPKWTWFEVNGEIDPAKELRVYPVPGYPAPAYGLTAPNWRGPDHKVKLKAWWTGSSFAKLARPFDVDAEQNLLDQKERPWGNTKELERIILESVVADACSLRLPNKDGVETTDPVAQANCLIVRLRYPDKAGPYFVQLKQIGDWERGQAHRWFHEAGKYTGIFWPVRPEDVKNIKTLYLYSVPELKDQCVPVEMDLGNPSRTSYKRPPVP